MKRGIWVFLLLIGGPVLVWAGTPQDGWNGYVQVRFSGARGENPGFSLRRAKLWTSGTACLPAFRYRVQVKAHFKRAGAFVLQDAYGEWHFASGWLRFGQMVPAFSLQRLQPDSRIPVIERALAVKALVPAAETDGRDIGLELHGRLGAGRLQWFAGLFNGSGGNRPGNEDRNFLVTGRAELRLRHGENRLLNIGVSLAYRKTSGLSFAKITGSERPFRGRDVRFGADMQLAAGPFQLQAEFLQARLDGRRAYGGYVQAVYRYTPAQQLVFWVEKMHDLNPRTDDSPWFALAYNYLLHGRLAKLILDVRQQPADRGAHTAATAQFQLFFH